MKQIKNILEDQTKNVNKLINHVKKSLDMMRMLFILWAIAQEMPAGKHAHINEYNLETLNEDILNNKIIWFY
jgi:hypothetical protein